MKLSVVIPLYNEENNVKPLLGKIQEAVNDPELGLTLDNNVEFILVDNGSKDLTRKRLEENISQIKNARICYVDTNIGYGNGILQGLKAAKGEILSWTHADLQTDPKDALRAYHLKTKANKNVIIKGQRKGRKLLEAFFTWGMQLYVLHKLKVSLSDINAQPKLFDRNFYNNCMNNAPNDFSLDLYFLIQAKKHGYETLNIPVYFNKRHSGEAKGGGSFKTKFKLIARTVKYINEFKNN